MTEAQIRRLVHLCLAIIGLAFTISHGNLHTRIGELEAALEVAASEVAIEVTETPDDNNE